MRHIQLTAAALVIAVSTGGLAQTNIVEQTAPKPLLRAVSSDFAPYSVSVPNRPLQGYAVDLLRASATRAGYRIEFTVVRNPREAVDRLAAGMADVHPHLAPSPERRELLDFTTNQVSEARVYRYALNKEVSARPVAGERVGFNVGSINERVARRFERVELHPASSNEELLLALLDGRVDTIVSVAGAIERTARIVSAEERLFRIGEPLLAVPIAFAFRKGQPEALDRIDTALREVQLSGQYDEIRSRWFWDPAPDGLAQHWLLLSAAAIFLVLSTLGISTAYNRYRTRAEQRIASRISVAQQAARSEETGRFQTLLHELFRPTHFGLIMLNADGMMTFANEAAQALLGTKSLELPAPLPPGIIITPHDQATQHKKSPVEFSVKFLSDQTDTPVVFAVQTPHSDSTRFWRITKTSLANTDFARQQITVLIRIEDVTTEEISRQHAEQLSRLESLGQLTGGIAHDFNNLLGTFLGTVQLIQRKSHDSETAEDLRTLEAAARRGSDLTNQLVAFAKRQPQSNRTTDLALVIANLRRVDSILAQSLDTRISINIDAPARNIWIACDSTQLENALLNLIINSKEAISSSGQREGSIVLSHKINDDELGDTITFNVTDDGPGMEPDQQKHAFEPFFSTKSGDSNAGLGLSTVYGFVSQSEGSIELRSFPGRGTRISFTLPLARQPVENPSTTDEDQHGVRFDKTVLLTEDDADLRETTLRMLRELGFNTMEAADAKDALAVLENNNTIDYLLTDVMLPGKNGFELAEQAIQTRPDLRIIYVSGYVGLAEKVRATVNGPFISKPCDIVSLRRAFEEAESINT